MLRIREIFGSDQWSVISDQWAGREGFVKKRKDPAVSMREKAEFFEY